MGRNKADLHRADDYEDVVRVWRMAEMVSNHIQGLPHPRRLIFEDDRYPDLDDVVEEYEFEGQSLFTRCWQVKRQTDKTPANILKDIIRSLAANDSLRARRA